MNPYDDNSTNREQSFGHDGRGGEPGPDDYRYDEGPAAPAGDPPVGRAVVGRASVGGPPAGRASVPVPPVTRDAQEPRAEASYRDQAGYGDTPYRDDHRDDYQDGFEDPRGAALPGSGAATGRASVGRASVPSPTPRSYDAPVDPYESAPHEAAPYDATPYDATPYGSAADPYDPSDGSYPSGEAHEVAPAPRWRSPGAPVGRARPGMRANSESGDDRGGPGGPGGNDRGPGGARGTGPGGGGGRGGEPPRGGGRGPRGKGGDTPARALAAKKARRRNILIAAFAVLIMLTGAGFVGGTYYVDSVKAPSELNFPETTTVYYSDGSVMARLGEVTRYEVKYADMNPAVGQAIVASEDNSFWTNEGVDFTGVMRAAWNNVTGGAQQGASTITQQYARVAFDLSGSTYSRKLREAVLAWKLSDELSKEQILEYYLNSVPFGRQTYGIEAAAQAFFGKTVKKNAPPEQQITVSEAMALVLMVKQPNPDPADPKGSPGYDPTFSPEAETNARDRWDYVRGQMVGLKYLTQADADKLEYPKADFKPDTPNASNGTDAPVGLVINHVFSELTHSPTSQFKGAKWQTIRDGGYKIYTTINPGAQKAAEAAADETVQGSFMFGQPANLQAALVAVEPGTGRVLAYYGGHDGNGSDFGGYYYDEDGKASGFGRFPPGSSFKVYTLAAALKAGVSLDSYWQWTPHDMPGRVGPNQIRNASSCPGDMKSVTKVCTLLQSTTASLNVPYYGVTASIGSAKVLDMAKAAGIDAMWTDDRQLTDLTKVSNMTQVTPSKFDTIVGIGQYPVSVTDHANGLATFAADGLRAQAHFVSKVLDGNDKIVYGETLPAPNAPRILNQAQINDLDYALSTISTAKIPGLGWDTAGKTGTWEYNNKETENAHAWMVGYTKKLSAAVWVGNKAEEQSIKDKSNSVIWGSGIPSKIWQAFMTNATKAINLPKVDTKFKPASHVGNDNPPGSAPSPSAPDPNQGSNNGGNPNDGANNGGNNGGNNNGGTTGGSGPGGGGTGGGTGGGGGGTGGGNAGVIVPPADVPRRN